MNQNDLLALKEWFASYCASFSTPVAEDQRNITVKQDHTREVCLNSLRIARELRLNEERVLLAEAIALFHDVGRFSQYWQYKTFDDSISVNHAALGAKVLLEKSVLRDLPKQDRDMIVRTVALHNVFALPEGLDEDTLLFVRLIRDADKLDILRVVFEYFGQDGGSRAQAVALGLADGPGYSPAVLESLKRGGMVRYADMRTQNDFKLLQLAWFYDLNFTASLRMAVEHGYIEKFAAMLPPNEEVAQAVGLVREYVRGKLEMS